MYNYSQEGPRGICENLSFILDFSVLLGKSKENYSFLKRSKDLCVCINNTSLTNVQINLC